MQTQDTKSKVETNTLRQVPTLSLGSYTQGSEADKAKFIEQLFTGIKDYGFIILKDHDVSQSLLKESYQVLEQFYKLPDQKKRSYISEKGGGQRGYTAFGTEHAKGAEVKDLKEFWHVGREVPDDHVFSKYYPKNIWPDDSII